MAGEIAYEDVLPTLSQKLQLVERLPPSRSPDLCRPLPTQPFEEISLDFVTGLPPCQYQDRIVDATLVIVDRFTKIALFIPTTTTLTAA
jgi:hypothetical protein